MSQVAQSFRKHVHFFADSIAGLAVEQHNSQQMFRKRSPRDMAYLTSFDSRQLRTVLGTFTTGVTIVTTHDAAGVDYGVTANSFSSVSLDPPLVLWSQVLTSKSFPAFRDNDHFAVNVLADDQVDISNHFAKSKEDKFAELEFSRGLGGVPVLQGTVAHFECVKVAAYPAGDHMIFLGRVERVSHSGRRPLAFAHGRYMVPYAHDLGPVSLREAKAPLASCDAVATAMDALPRISESVGGFTVGLAVWGNHGPTIVRWRQGVNAVHEQLRTGLVMSTTRTATGIAFAAFLPPEVTEPFVKEDLRLFRVADEDEQLQRCAFDDMIAGARASGLARAFNIQPSALIRVAANAFSAPVYDADGAMICALSVAAEASALAPDPAGAVPQALLRAAKELTSKLQG
jgi:flavin reductase (DIM6/NTAB) family NADH-FMN oxidoreductase RutF/DNA-binding IclR family transcriptional regulator